MTVAEKAVAVPAVPSLAEVGERLSDERDRAIRGAHYHGVPIASIARMVKMSVQSVSLIVTAGNRL